MELVFIKTMLLIQDNFDLTDSQYEYRLNKLWRDVAKHYNISKDESQDRIEAAYAVSAWY